MNTVQSGSDMLLQSVCCITPFDSVSAMHAEQTCLHVLHELRNFEKLPSDPSPNRMNECVITESSKQHTSPME